MISTGEKPAMSASKTAGVYTELREDLLNGVYQPGSKLMIDALATRFRVSPSAVREALSRLTSERLVVAMPQKGFTVATVSQEDLDDLTQVRIEIETRCLRRSIELGDIEWEAALLASWHRLCHAGASPLGRAHPDWERLHAQFHDDLVAACDSPWWLRLRHELYIQAERYRRMVRSEADTKRDIEAEHRAILDRTMARDADGAVAALSRHLSQTADHVRRTGLTELLARADRADAI